MKTKIVILVEGGAVQAVWSEKDASEIEVVLVDKDNIAAGEPHPLGSDDNFEDEIKELHQVF